MAAGRDTYRVLEAANAAKPGDLETVFKLARKLAERGREDKAVPLYREVLTLDPSGRGGTFRLDFVDRPVPYAEYAEYELARFPLQGRGRDPKPMTAFLEKHPDGAMARMAYSGLDVFHYGAAPLSEAGPFYEAYTAKFPNEAYVYQKWLDRIVREKGDFDRGLEIAARLEALTRDNPDPYVQASIAELHLARGDKAAAEETFGRAFYESQVSNAAFGLLQYADFWARHGANADTAEAAAEAALRIEPANQYVHQRAAGVYLALGREAKALEAFGPAFIKRYWDEPGEMRTYIWFWTQQGKNLDGALAAARRALDLRPGAYYHWSSLADVYAKMGDYAEAVKAGEKAVETASPAARPAMEKNLEKLKAQRAASLKK